MFAKKFGMSLVLCLFLAWMAFGFYPLVPPHNYNLNPHFHPLPITTLMELFGRIFCAIVGLFAAIFCAGFYLGTIPDRRDLTKKRSDDPINIAPWASPFALLFLGATIFGILELFLERKNWDLEATLGSGMLLFVLLSWTVLVVRGSLVRMLPKRQAQET